MKFKAYFMDYGPLYEEKIDPMCALEVYLDAALDDYPEPHGKKICTIYPLEKKIALEMKRRLERSMPKRKPRRQRAYSESGDGLYCDLSDEQLADMSAGCI